MTTANRILGIIALLGGVTAWILFFGVDLPLFGELPTWCPAGMALPVALTGLTLSLVAREKSRRFRSRFSQIADMGGVASDASDKPQELRLASLIEGLKDRGFEVSSRSETLYYHPLVPDVRFVIRKQVVRLEERDTRGKERRWHRLRSFSIAQETSLALRVADLLPRAAASVAKKETETTGKKESTTNGFILNLAALGTSTSSLVLLFILGLDEDRRMECLTGLAIGAFVVGFFVILNFLGRRCPKCGHFAMKETSKKKIGDEYTRTTEFHEIRRYVNYRVYSRCQNCGYTRESEREEMIG